MDIGVGVVRHGDSNNYALGQNGATSNKLQMWITVLKVVLWVAGLYYSRNYHLESLYFIFSAFYLIFTNLGHRQPGQLSSYSVFNKNFQRLPGTMDGDVFSLRPKYQHSRPSFEQQHPDFKSQHPNSEEPTPQEKQQYFRNLSRSSNKECYCGSGAKFKKCCLFTSRKEEEEARQRRIKGQGCK